MDKKIESISSIDKALDILLLFYKEKRELGISEISRLLSMPKSTVHRTILTLEQKGFVFQIQEGGKYWLGMKLYSIGMATWENNKLNKIVQPYARDLSAKFSETVSVSILDDKTEIPHTTVIYKEEAMSNRLRTSHEVGENYAVHTTAVGKAILAFSSQEVIDKLKNSKLEKNTENTITTIDQLEHELAVIRSRGYAIDNEEEEIGLKCIAAPIFDSSNKVIAAISVSGPVKRIDLFDKENVAKTIIETAAKISEHFK
ncbi:IclR family transcriptional regulator [Clostridium sp. PL3]|uniref:IclR family transcriptional regulator n=1 Tax=Clostridium thailandense TaxID=2794346 RepID=A0A949TL68_9CLOT|nr:IclR family transcriptional regulator [Clostridium thailandense]MBV7274350.1 IclR family transcriptional regulator [Clostridium thailandense]